MKKPRFWLVMGICLVVLALSACSPQPKREHLAFWDELVQHNNTIHHFTDYNSFDSFKGDHSTLIIAGLRHKSEVARWFAAEKSIEYIGQKGADRIEKELKKINRDPVDEVRSAVGLAENIFAGTHREMHRVKAAPNRESFIVHRFVGAEYNDRTVWVLKNGRLSALQTLDGSVISVKFASDSRWVAVAHAGRIWMGTALIEIQTGKTIDLLPWDFLEQQGFLLDLSHPRPDPRVAPAEWRGSKLLLSYVYHDSNYEAFRGHVVYDLEIEGYVRAYPPERATDLIMTPNGWDK